jgi:glycerophosphoryl diester phosphodiesterase
MKIYRVLPLLISLVTVKSMAQNNFDTQGHRGARGLMPENTIPAMKVAQDLGVTLEMDISFSKDKKVIVSHDQWMNAGFVLTPDGKEIPVERQKEDFNLYKMPYKKIRNYDVGSKVHKGFPKQKKMTAYIPKLSELINSVEAYAKEKNYKAPYYNIETKTNVKGDDIFHPAPEEFVKRLMKVIKSRKIEDRVIIQSFDVRTLEIMHKKHPGIKTAYLVSKGGLEENLKLLSFKPDIYSPAYKLVNKELVNKCHDLGLKVIPWTVNTKKEIDEIKNMGVDGIISDYPNLF